MGGRGGFSNSSGDDTTFFNSLHRLFGAVQVKEEVVCAAVAAAVAGAVVAVAVIERQQ